METKNSGGVWLPLRGVGLVGDRQRGIETVSAARFVEAAIADQHAVAAGHEALRMVRRIAADHADGERLGDVLRDGQQLRHRIERPSEVVLVEAGDNHALAPVGERVARGRQVRVEELSLVDADHLGFVGDHPHQLVGVRHVLGRDALIAMRHDMVVAEAVVENRLEDLHFLPRNLDAPQPANELFALAAEHAAGDDFDPAALRLFSDDVHRKRPGAQTRD